MRAAYEIRKPALGVMFAYPEDFGWADRCSVSCSGFKLPASVTELPVYRFFAETSIHLPFHSIYSSMEFIDVTDFSCIAVKEAYEDLK